MLEDLFKTVTKRFNGDDPDPAVPMFKCPRCGASITQQKLAEFGKVCPGCQYHARLTAAERISVTADKGSFEEFDSSLCSADPLEFPGYAQKVTELQQQTGMKDAVITGKCTIKGSPAVLIVMDSRFMMASMGSVVGEKITRAFEYAAEEKLPVVAFTASGGARMQEGIISLMQMAKTSAAVQKHNEAGQLYITVMTDPTTGGVTASFASLGDIIIAEPKVLIGFAGRRVIEGTIKQHLPDDFQLAEFQLEHGYVDMIVRRKKMRSVLSHLLKLHGYNAVTKKQEVSGDDKN